MPRRKASTFRFPLCSENPLDIEMSHPLVECVHVSDSARTHTAEDREQLPFDLAYRDEVRGIWLYHADCLTFMDRVAARHPDGCFDMIFADPPYFLSNGGITCQAGRMVCVDKGAWDKSRGPQENHEFNLAWLDRCQRVLKPNGTIWVSGTAHIIHSVGYAMQQLGFKLLNDITWVKPNPPPNLSCRYFTHATETIIWAAKNNKSKHYFNYRRMRQLAGGKQMKSLWFDLKDAPTAPDIWEILPPSCDEKVFGKHPTQKPVALLRRIVEAGTQENALVLDPFAGSCTTGIACLELKRKFIGIELDPGFVHLSVQRIQSAGDRASIFASG